MEVSRILHQMPKPVVAQVDGAAAGAMSIALACDPALRAPPARSLPLSQKSASPAIMAEPAITHLLGSAKARELYLMSPILTAQEAQHFGIVTRWCRMPRSRRPRWKWRCRWRGPSVTLGYIKRNINNAETMSLEACFDAEAIHHSRSGETADRAAKAFVEKRKPAFLGH
jgi:2-(1,2-epoxy-1,2-dihydrophenyl)acetyl-CoA isomerase